MKKIIISANGRARQAGTTKKENIAIKGHGKVTNKRVVVETSPTPVARRKYFIFSKNHTKYNTNE